MYISTASEAMSAQQLNEILEESRAWNKSHELTGFLAYVEGQLKVGNYCRFVQVLEGPKSEVVGIFDNIERDSRHRNVFVVKKGIIPDRNFGTWEMGFEKINLDEHPDLQEFFHMDPEAIAEEGDVENNMLLDFLKVFNKNISS